MFEDGGSGGGREGQGEAPDSPAPWDPLLSPVGEPTVHDVSAALDDLATLQARIDALEGEKLLAVERARRTAGQCETALLADEEVQVLRAGADRRHQLARRAFVADVATTLRLGEQQAQHLVDTAQTLTSAGSATLHELCRGKIGAAHARATADALVDLPDAPARAAVQAATLPEAATSTLTQFRARLRRARDRAHPEPFTARHDKALEKRAVFVDPAADGMAWLSACLPATTAHAAYDRLTRAGRAARDAGDPRSLPQLRADAYAALLLAGADDVAPPAAPATAPRPVKAAATTTAAVDDGGVPDLADQARRITPRVHVTVPVMALLDRSTDPAELAGHGPIDPRVASSLTAAAPSLRRLLVDPTSGTVLATDPGTYTVPAALRAYLEARDGRCRFPGCTRAAEHCDVDHTVAWADGGRTVADNLAHLCRRHHVLKHQTRWSATQAPDGTMVWTSPTGRVTRDPVADPVDLTGRELRPPDAPDPP
ncbi:HNH endonuclease signature motif containing protein [Isoptericola sp. NPDC055881]